MALTYKSISHHPKNFQDLIGLTLEEFNKMAKKVRPLYIKWESKKKEVGRPSGFATIEDKLLCLMMYYRTYIIHTFLGYLFGLHNANVCRMFKILEPMVANTVKIKQDRKLIQNKVMEILNDMTSYKPKGHLRNRSANIQVRKNVTLLKARLE